MIWLKDIVKNEAGQRPRVDPLIACLEISAELRMH